MSKPALGRGLGSLLKSGQSPDAEPSAQNPVNPAPNGGVKLLLRGREDENPSESIGDSAAWLSPGLIAADLVLVLAGCLLLFSRSPSTRLAAGILLVLVGAGLATAVAVLNQRPAARPQPRPSPPDPSSQPPPTAAGTNSPVKGPQPPPGPKVRVHFVDEFPRQRKN